MSLLYVEKQTQRNNKTRNTTHSHAFAFTSGNTPWILSNTGRRHTKVLPTATMLSSRILLARIHPLGALCIFVYNFKAKYPICWKPCLINSSDFSRHCHVG